MTVYSGKITSKEERRGESKVLWDVMKSVLELNEKRIRKLCGMHGIAVLYISLRVNRISL